MSDDDDEVKLEGRGLRCFISICCYLYLSGLVYVCFSLHDILSRAIPSKLFLFCPLDPSSQTFTMTTTNPRRRLNTTAQPFPLLYHTLLPQFHFQRILD